jgi:hypothetical protein
MLKGVTSACRVTYAVPYVSPWLFGAEVSHTAMPCTGSAWGGMFGTRVLLYGADADPPALYICPELP